MGGPRPPLVGRAEELAQLQDWAGRPGAPGLLLAGPAGAGRSRLVDELLAHLGGDGPRVLLGHCAVDEAGPVPYAALLEALRGLLGADDTATGTQLAAEARALLASLHPELRPPPAGRTLDPGRLHEAARALLAHTAKERDVLVVVEDVHWMADPGLALLAALLRDRLERVHLLVTARLDVPAVSLHRLVADARHAGLLEVLELRPLTPDAVAELVAGLLPGADLTVVRAVQRLAEGRPAVVGDLVEQGRATGSLEVLPPHLVAPLQPVLERLGGPARAVLQAVAVADEPVRHRELGPLSDLPPPAVDAAVQRALAGGLLVVTPDGRGYRCRDALVAHVCAATLLPAERLRLHRALAVALAERVQQGDVPPSALARLAHHYDEAGEDEAAVRWSLVAAGAAERAGETGTALELTARALALWPRGRRSVPALSADREATALRASTLAARLGDHATGRRLVEQTLRGVVAADPVRARLTARRDWHRVLGLAEEPPEVEPLPVRDVPPAARADLLAARARLLLVTGAVQEAEPLARRALALADVVQDRPARAAALTALGAAHCLAGRHDGERLLDRACDQAAALDDVDLRSAAEGTRLAARLLRGEDVLADVEDLQESLSRRGVAGGHLHLLAAVAALELGRWPEARVRVGSVVRSGGALLAVLAQALGVLLAALGGEDRPAPPAPALPLPAARLRAAWLAEAALTCGRPAEAAACARAALGPGPDGSALCGPLLVLALRAQADRAVQGWDSGDRQLVADARAEGARLLDLARDLPGALDPRTGRVAAALGTDWYGEHTRLAGVPSATAWADAAAAWQSLGRPHRTAYALWRRAEALLADRPRSREAAPVLAAAGELAARLGAVPLQRELDRLARRGGLSRTAVAAPEEAASRPLLTAREGDVLRLLADGLSNRAIAETLVVSPKTVDTHVSHLLLKLDVHDRVAAASRAQRLGLLS